MAMKFPQYLSTSTRTVSVVGMVDKEGNDETGVFQDGKGYIDEDEQIWIFSGSGKPKNANEYPYFWLDEDGKKVFSEPQDITLKAYNTENMVDMSLVNIIDTTEEGEELFNEEEINDMNAAAAFFVPIIHDSDDFLKKLVKSTIIKKGIDINRLKAKTGAKYQLPNMKAALTSDTKMSVNYFNNWMELLGCNYDIIITDSGEDRQDPLKHEVYFSSVTSSTTEFVNGEMIPIAANTSITKEGTGTTENE
jgi:hypothetical protein